MANLFTDVLDDLDNVQQTLLGPDYKYFKQIRTPSELGASSDGGLDQLADNIEALIAYVELLVSGGGDASVTENPLGNKFFLKTGAKCKVVSNDAANGSIVNRYVYVNNVPDGNIPFISSGLGGVQFSEFSGLIPGTMTNAAAMNPFALFQAFQLGSTPDCQSITLETIDVNNNVSSATNYVATANLKTCRHHGFQIRQIQSLETPLEKLSHSVKTRKTPDALNNLEAFQVARFLVCITLQSDFCVLCFCIHS